MKFIDISRDVCVNSDKISYVATEDNGVSCIVCIGDKEYKSSIPYATMVGMLRGENQKYETTMDRLGKYLSTATITTV